MFSLIFIKLGNVGRGLFHRHVSTTTTFFFKGKKTLFPHIINNLEDCGNVFVLFYKQPACCLYYHT